MGKKIDLSAKKFGRLTVIKDSGKRDNNGSIMWECRCECGNTVFVSGTSLTHGFTKSCSCLQKDIVSEYSKSRLNDLSGQRFGRLTVLRLTENIVGKKKRYVCKCDCGNEIIVQAGNLTNGHTQSCGCLVVDKNSGQKKINEYEVVDGYVKVMLNDNDYMLCDIEDWERLKNYGWGKGNGGYAVSGTQTEGKFYFHKKVTNTTTEIVDHINRNKLDNRKCNLRITDQRVNAINSKMPINNTSGYKGVRLNKHGSWVASITVNKKHIYLGSYKTKEEAVIARKAAEDKYYKPLLEKAVPYAST